MARYIIRRVLLMIPVMLLVIVIVYTISYLSPGDPVMIILGDSNYTPEAYAKLAAKMGLDKGYLAQVGTYIWNIVTKLDLGKSYLSNIPVSQELAARLPTTFRIRETEVSVMSRTLYCFSAEIMPSGSPTMHISRIP